MLGWLELVLKFHINPPAKQSLLGSHMLQGGGLSGWHAEQEIRTAGGGRT